MRFLILSTFTALFLASSLAHAAIPQLNKQIPVLKHHTAFPQRVGC